MNLSLEFKTNITIRVRLSVTCMPDLQKKPLTFIEALNKLFNG